MSQRQQPLQNAATETVVKMGHIAKNAQLNVGIAEVQSEDPGNTIQQEWG